ncbi:MAG: response regulator, partial [Odoribacter sp.]|nr:response regulator [Odoribacter sp.]
SILLVDDDTDMLAFLNTQLESEYKVYKAESANQAFEMLEKENISLVISDIMMPGIDGLELCKRIKESKEFCHLPVILLSAKSLSVHQEQGFNAGADAYITKPFKVSMLKTRIRNILSIRTQLKSIYNNTDLSESLGIKKDNEEQEFVEKCMDILKTHATLNGFDVEMFVKEVGMSRAAFYRKWKSVTHLSPAEAIRNLRLECAAELLSSCSLTATEIAYEVGFNNYTHFSAAFKARYGVSPKEYKQT